jgi:hypothetical protein
MAVKLIDLKKIAILKDLEITFKESSSGHAWKIARDGVLKFAVPKPWGEPLDYTPEQTLGTADVFSLVTQGKQQVLSRQEMENFLTEALKAPHAAKAVDEEHD